MKRLVLLHLVVMYLFSAQAAVRTWDGGGSDGLWNNALNWDGDILPAATDDIILDNSTTSGSYIVTLPSGAIAVSVNSLVISPAGTNNITLLLPATNIIAPAFTATGAGDAIVLNNGAILKNSSGASLGIPVTVTSTNYFRINNGGRYIHNTQRSSTDYLVSRLSAVAGTETGIFEFDVPGAAGFTISLNGRTFGTLILSAAASGGAKTYSGSGTTPMHIKGNLEIKTGATLASSMSGAITIHKKLIQHTGSAFNIQTSSNNNSVSLLGDAEVQGVITKTGTGLPVFTLQGSSNQNISIGSITNNIAFAINNAAGATLLAPLTLPGSLVLTSGNIKTSSSNLLILSETSTYTGSSVNSFIEGPVKKIKPAGNTYIFPVGKGSIYAPVSLYIAAGFGAGDEFTAEYKRANPQTTYGINYATPIHHISYTEYWELIQNAGVIPAAGANVTLTATQYSFAKLFSPSLFVAKHDADNYWRSAGTASSNSTGTAGGYVTGTITSSTINELGIFTWATTDNTIDNPLPVKLISFNADLLSTATCLLKWQTAEYLSALYEIEIEKAGSDMLFTTIAVVAGNNTTRLYTYTDVHLQNEKQYYRLKMKDAAGVVTYSNAISVVNNFKEQTVISIITAGNTRQPVLHISSPKEQLLQIIIADMQGRVVKRIQYSAVAGTMEMPLPTDDLRNGIYLVYGISKQAKTNVVKFNKQ